MILEKFIYYYLKVVKFGEIIQQEKVNSTNPVLDEWFSNSQNTTALGHYLVNKRGLNLNDVPDVIQETHYKAHKSFDGLRKLKYLSTWIYSIAINQTLDFQRRFNRTQSHEVGIDELLDSQLYHSGIFEESPESSYERKEHDRLVLKAFNMLDPRFKAILLLTQYEEMVDRDAADTLGITAAQAKTWIHQGRVALKLNLNYLLSNGVPSQGHTKESIHFQDLSASLWDEIEKIRTRSSEGVVYHNQGYSGNSLNGKSNIYPLLRPSRQQHYQRKAHGTPITLEQSVANL